ncbi:MAG: hypothetical protein IJN90_00480 [Bacilli bacterium]|nr:hypothetical protein [Bacilli bacterium]
MNSYSYFESLKFDHDRVMKKNISRVVGLKNIKVIGKYKEKNKYNYVFLGDKIIDTKDIIILIDNNLLRIDNLDEVKRLDNYMNNYSENIDFFNRNKFKKRYSLIKDRVLLSLYKEIIKVYDYCKKYHIKVKDIYLINYDKNLNNNNMIKELDSLVSAYLLDYEDRINYIYDYMCNYLDNEFNEFNLCDFVDNKCVSRRDLECSGCKNPVVYGCCYTKGRVCPNLINSRCTIKSLPCKFFTCRYLEKKGIKYRPWDYLLIRLFLNRRQMIVLDQSLYTEKEIIIAKLVKRNYIDYLYMGIRKVTYNVFI